MTTKKHDSSGRFKPVAKLQRPINLMIADDNKEVCESMEKTIISHISKYGLEKNALQIKKIFTDHAYEFGCQVIKDENFIPDICIFDLVFNGYTGVDLYKFITQNYPADTPWLCIYTGVERNFEKRKDAESLAAKSSVVKIVAKPKIDEITSWFCNILETEYELTKIIDEGIDPFDLL